MKKRILIVSLLLLSIFLTGATTKNDLTIRQDKLHEIAEIAREIGLEETDQIIKRAQELWWEAQALKEKLDEDVPMEDNDTPPVEEKPPAEEPWYTEEDIRIVATVIYNEAWYGCSERHRELVGAVLVNRVKSPQFPNTVYACVVQPKQYNPGYATGRYPVPDFAWETCRELAIRALNGEVECPDNVLFQSNYPNLGKGWYEVHYTSYSTTYFAYG